MFEAHSQIFLALKFFGAGAAAMLGADVLLVFFAPFSARVKDIFRALIFFVFSAFCYYFLVVNLTFERVRGFLVASFALGTFVERKIFGKVLAIISLKVYNIFKKFILGIASRFKRAFAKIRQMLVIKNKERELDSIKAEIAALREENESLEDDIDKWQSSWKIEEKARELGWRYPDDK